jgi:lipopolysaccharide biosynthesis regulator YciM
MTLEIEPWWLLALPLFFALGWWASRLDQRASARTAAPAGESMASEQALLALLRDDAPAAIEALTARLGVEPDSASLQCALGLLYRRRGEVDRAIRVHQALADRADLDPVERQRAQLELGIDFVKAGLIDRAEATLSGLEGSPFASEALGHRIEMAQSVRDWPRALSLTEAAERTGAPSQAIRRMHLHCEMAHESADPDLAREAIERAFEATRDHPRPWMLLGLWASSRNDTAGAIEAWTRMAALSPEHLILVQRAWQDAWAAMGDADTGARQWSEQMAAIPHRAAVHACAQCGFKARRHYWQCPGCNAWDTLAARGERPA